MSLCPTNLKMVIITFTESEINFVSKETDINLAYNSLLFSTEY